MRAVYLQTNPRFLAPEENRERALRTLEGIRADLAVLPELFTSGYNFRSKKEVRRMAETVPGGPTVQALQSLARRRRMAIAAGLAERDGSRLYNSAVLVTPKQVFLYRKIHLFAREKLFFAPGNLGFRVFSYSGVKIGLMVCFDWFFPEACRTLALKGAQVIAHPSNLVLPWCPEAMKIRCLENRVFAVTANRVGRERDLSFIGRSQIVSPRGEVIQRASGTRPENGLALLDVAQAANKQLNRFNNLFADRRPAVYR
jgi:predicted amidohydrolase